MKVDSNPAIALPDVTEDDMAWVCRVLRLHELAFVGADGQDARAAILKSHATLDVEACPGSGKTTLLVAKLAVLARHWVNRCRGICVLSHTNVARLEIESRLGATHEGRHLLSYPHFVGTIHGFVNEFIALPWLRSKGFPIRRIDDEVTCQQRWNRLQYGTRQALTRNRHKPSHIRIVDTGFGLQDLKWGRGTLGKDAAAYKEIQASCQGACEAGFFCYDEMFVWAEEALNSAPELLKAIRRRFPLLFIDEVQDNSEVQSAILYRIFSSGSEPVIRQRFGDANQAIFGHTGAASGATTDPFPSSACQRTVANSHRFGPEIAALATRLAALPPDLVGAGPSNLLAATNTAGKHAVFLFDDGSLPDVLPTYGNYLIGLFSEDELRAGTFTAIGAVHRPADGTTVPRSVSHYWADYDHALTTFDPRPANAQQHIAMGRARAQKTGELHFLVEEIAEAVLRLAALGGATLGGRSRARRHRHILELLSPHPTELQNYRELVAAAIAGRVGSGAEWSGKWAPLVRHTAEAICGRAVATTEASAFLGSGAVAPADVPARGSNVFRYPLDAPKVGIRVGSIHGAKGETHTATLVLETFYRTHNLKALLPWLLGKKKGSKPDQAARLKQHYVAMTRPTHLLCLAMREDGLRPQQITDLKAIGWQVARVQQGNPTWL